MSIQMHIPANMDHYTCRIQVVDVKGSTVGECINDLLRQFPDMKEGLFTENGKLKKDIDIWVNMESSYPEELLKKVKDGDTIYITGNGGA